MKRTRFLFGVIAVVALTGFLLMSCNISNGGGKGGSGGGVDDSAISGWGGSGGSGGGKPGGSTTNITITFDGNGYGTPDVDGTGKATLKIKSGGTIPAKTVVDTSGFTIPSGEVFIGWYTDSDLEKGSKVVFGTTKFSADTTLYAQCAAATEVVFDLNDNGGWTTNPPVFQSAFVLDSATGDARKITAPDFATADCPSGYTFGGWFEEADCITEWNFAANTVTASATPLTLFAKITTTVGYNTKGGGTAPADETGIQIGQTVTLDTGTSYSKAGLNLKDLWWTVPGGNFVSNGAEAASVSELLMDDTNGGTTVYLRWVAVLTLNKGDLAGSITPNQITDIDCDTPASALALPTRDDGSDTINFWCTDATDSSSIAATRIDLATATITADATWIAVKN